MAAANDPVSVEAVPPIDVNWKVVAVAPDWPFTWLMTQVPASFRY